MLHPGTIIQSTEALRGDFFEDARIILVECNSKGSIGFMLNRADGRMLNQLDAYRNAPPLPFYVGGPMDQEHIYVIHRRPDLVSGGTRFSTGIYYGADFDELLDAVNQGLAGKDDLKLFLGYCGWDAGELEAEIAEGSWQLVGDLRGPGLQGPDFGGLFH